MKKTSIFAFLMIAMSFMAKAQSPRLVTSPSMVFDGMDSIVVHYNPYGSGGDHGDTSFQTYNGGLYAYCYLNVSGSTAAFNNGSWAGVVTAVDSFVKVSDSDWVWVMPDVRQFFGVPKDVYVTGVNLIVKDAGTPSSDTQSANLFISVSESPTLMGDGQPISTGPVTNIATHTFVPDANENVVIYYHPQQDTFIHEGQAGDSVFKTADSTLYVWAWAIASNGSQYDITPGGAWSAVPTTPNDLMVEIDSNTYAWDIRNLRADFIQMGMPSGVSIDSIGFIPRTSGNGGATVLQTPNFYVPLVVDTVSHVGVSNVNAAAAKVSLYPNPATTGIFVSYTLSASANVNVSIENMMGQTVMTQNLGQHQVGNVYLSVETLPAGTYLVVVTNDNNKTVQRLTKQ